MKCIFLAKAYRTAKLIHWRRGCWTRQSSQGCQVGLFQAKFAKFGLLLDGWPRNFVEVIKYLAFFKVWALI